MKKMIVLALLVFGMNASAQNNKLTTALKDDKNLHFMAGMNISNAVGSAVFYKTRRPFLSCVSGFLAGSLAGIAKEAIYDKAMHRGVCDNQDALTTIWGSLAGSLTLRAGINIAYEKKLPDNPEQYEFK